MNSSVASWVRNPAESRAASTPYATQLTMGLILLVHVVATFLFLPPSELLRDGPLLVVDHSLHSHRIHVYRESLYAGGLPWGYDPQVEAGFAVDPRHDVGAKPQQVLGVVLFFLDPGTVERVFIFFVVLTIPLWMLLSCRKIGLPIEAQLCVLVTLLIPLWLFDNLAQFVFWGMVAFAASCYMAPYVVALFMDFANHPNLKTYLIFCLAGALLFYLHVLGPVVIALPLLLVILMTPSIPARWRLGMVCAPIIIFALNGFWAVPFLQAFLGMPSAPIPSDLDLTQVPHFASPHATYGSLREILSFFTPVRVVAIVGGLLCSIYGVVVMRKMVGTRIACVFGLVGLVGIGLKFFGSFIPGVVLMQPARFGLSTFVFLAVPMGLALYRISQYIRLSPIISTVGLVFCAVIGGVILDKPKSLAFTPPAMGLVDFVQNRTNLSDRLLIQSMGWEPRALPMLLDREVVGNGFPFSKDPTQFLSTMLWGKPIDAWEPREMGAILERWGISWCFTHNQQGRELFEKITKTSGEQVGKYRAFQISDSESRFLLGTGQIHATVNHIELSQLQDEDGLVVLRYRYHPAWETSSGVPVFQYALSEDPKGFLALKNPSETMHLVFNSRKMLSATWPNQGLSPREY